ncbi:MAG: hypothetical protein PF479_09790, partial [Oceanispirochaeta sp.]|nr:hypothetical protein [Oceanispirochaeta sp.]
MKNFKSIILSQKTIARGYLEMEFTWPEDCGKAKPGQFLTIKVHDNPVPLLRRPFALSSFNPEKGSASIIYQVRGAGTRILESLPRGAA